MMRARKRHKVIQIPKTSKNRYISRMFALNIGNEKHFTGDWHRNDWFCGDGNSENEKIYMAGEGTRLNTNHIFKDKGIYDATEYLKSYGFYNNCVVYKDSPVWCAEHERATVDFLYKIIKKKGRKINTRAVILDEWFPSVEDKIRVYEYINILEKFLDDEEKSHLDFWKKENPVE